MANISVSLPSDGETVDVADYNTPINTIVNEINGSLDNSNIAAAAAIAGSKLANTTVGLSQLDLNSFAPQYSFDASTRTTTSASYVTLTGAPSVTITVPSTGRIKLTIATQASGNGTAQVKLSFAASGGNTIAAADDNSVTNTTLNFTTGTRVMLLTGLTAGSTTFALRASVSAGTGSYARSSILAEIC